MRLVSMLLAVALAVMWIIANIATGFFGIGLPLGVAFEVAGCFVIGVVAGLVVR